MRDSSTINHRKPSIPYFKKIIFCRYHLQALRHLYVLAAEPRLILPRDIDTKRNCYATVHLTFKSERLANGQEAVLKAPCLLPQLDSLDKVELKDDRYWEIVFERGHNWQQLEGMLEKCGSLSVKQRAGCLSYLEDPHVIIFFLVLYGKVLFHRMSFNFSFLCTGFPKPARTNFDDRQRVDLGCETGARYVVYKRQNSFEHSQVFLEPIDERKV